MTGDGLLGLPRRREPDLVGLAAVTLDGDGRIVSWSVTATALFGHQAREVVGRDVCDVLMTGPGHRELVARSLAEVAAGRVHTATVAGGSLGEGRFALRWEPLAGPDGAALMIAARAWPQPAPSWLSQATARIGSSLDLVQTASEVVDAAVPGFADAAVIYAAERLFAAGQLASLRPGHGAAVRRLAARLAGQDEAVTGRLLPIGEVLVLGEDTLRSQAMTTGKPALSGQLDRETAERLARVPGGREVAEQYASLLAMPLIARGVIVGCATFGRAPASPAFNPGDIMLAGELASRAAVCLDNARLYDRERRIALALQRGLLPARPQVPDGLEVAPVYQPVGDNVVGGDWHDIVSLPGGRAALIVGDAMGHGPEAAAIMVQLRTAAHTLAGLELPPEQVLRRLDTMAAGMDPTAEGLTAAPFATCIYAVIDPSAGTGDIARAGHLPPVLALPDGATEVLDLPAGLPLGLGTGTFQATRISLAPGATLALYTDGLVENRTRPIDGGLAALRRALSSVLAPPGSALGDACQKVIQMLREHGEDDITLMLARIRQ
ncbi:MAG TPA: SpoIIE family protein phosphatase [Streptosporangiaceae bacterium]|jgi:serine phosphatase RsbU (regulator of sigma subunit)|nr:SpoIIE family protein phosphatase [Streptosporangiaceae bacterium]